MEKITKEQYLKQITEFYNYLFSFIEDEDNEEEVEEIIFKLLEEKETFGEILRIIIKISNNYHRTRNLVDKIKKILEFIEEKIKKTFSNLELFEIFKENKLLLLFVVQKGIILFDETILEHVIEVNCYKNGYIFFFLNEIKKIDEKMASEIEKEILSKNSQNLTNYEEKRNEGENDSYICSLIRSDSVEEFISYISRTNLSLLTKITPSIFETNTFLIDKEPTLIEYAAFFGSIQIIQYLKYNKVPLTSSLWLYSIHSNNAELIHFLEENEVKPENNKNRFAYSYYNDTNESFLFESKFYQKCFIEAIKCHHNDIANYLFDNYLNDTLVSEEAVSYGLHYYNYSFINEIHEENECIFYHLCKYGYYNIINFILQKKRYKYKMILKKLF